MGGIIEEEAILRAKLSSLSDRSMPIASCAQHMASEGIENRLSDEWPASMDKSRQ